MENIVIACSKKWFLINKKTLNLKKKKNVFFIKDKNKLTLKKLKKIKPTKIFFPHWSFKVPEEIIKNYECICFHTAPLPFGRGGSPIQNLILRGFLASPVCALKMTDTIDGGPIYLKRNVSLKGNLSEIFNRISNVINTMIKHLIKKKVIPKKQKGKIYYFERLNYKEGFLKQDLSLGKIYDKIRMLDSDQYPKAFIDLKNIKIELTNANFRKGIIKCDAKIFKKK